MTQILVNDDLMKSTGVADAIVDGKGEIHSTADDPQLLWALRGAGTAGLCIVAEMAFCTYRAPRSFRSYHFKTRNLSATRAFGLLEQWTAL